MVVLNFNAKIKTHLGLPIQWKRQLQVINLQHTKDAEQELWEHRRTCPKLGSKKGFLRKQFPELGQKG